MKVKVEAVHIIADGEIAYGCMYRVWFRQRLHRCQMFYMKMIGSSVANKPVRDANSPSRRYFCMGADEFFKTARPEGQLDLVQIGLIREKLAVLLS